MAHFSASYFPYAWLLMLPINFLIVALYNKFLPKYGCFKVALIFVTSIIGFNAFCSFYLAYFPKLSFIHFIWKDIYVMLMFQLVWSIVHSTMTLKRAKYLYGIIYGIGGMGSILGSCLPGFFASKIGSETLLLSTVVIYFLFIVSYKLILETREKIEAPEKSSLELPKESTSGGFSLIYRSKRLKFILLLVIFMQIASTLIDFQFNSFLETLITNKDLRTEFSGKLFGCIHLSNIFLQFFGTFIVIHLLGLKKSHILLPVLFGFIFLGFMIVPVFSLISLCFSMIKACDYSIFTIIKEMLYLPLKTEEKFKAKAVIDVFAHRSSKALASLAILFFQLVHLTSLISWCLLSIFLLWLGTVMILFKKQEALSA
jgi:AAA family ATP:ADP antiporter